MTEVPYRYGLFESYVAAFNDEEAWVLITGTWEKFKPGEVRMSVSPLSAGQAREMNDGKPLPALPPGAFTTPMRA